jgi:phage terminase large subunit
MYNADKIQSSEWDMAYVQEATELDINDWEVLTKCLRNKQMPYQQLIADCNPSYPTHWLKERCDRGATLMLESRHKDNPSFTGADMAVLEALTGIRYSRLCKGLWASAEGMVYQDEWNPAVHLIYRSQVEILPLWPRYWVIDWGFRNPFVWQAWAQDHDGTLYRYREIYKTGVIVEDHARQIMEVTAGEPRPVAIICDHDIEDRMTFERHTGLSTIPASKAISTGIQAVQARLRVGRNGRAGMYFLRDSLVEQDTELAKQHLPTSTETEFECYEWDTTNGRKVSEVPVDKHNHGQDCNRYLAMHVDNPAGSIQPLDDETAEALRGFVGY